MTTASSITADLRWKDSHGRILKLEIQAQSQLGKVLLIEPLGAASLISSKDERPRNYIVIGIEAEWPEPSDAPIP